VCSEVVAPPPRVCVGLNHYSANTYNSLLVAVVAELELNCDSIEFLQVLQSRSKNAAESVFL